MPETGYIWNLFQTAYSSDVNPDPVDPELIPLSRPRAFKSCKVDPNPE